MITFADILANEEIKAYIKASDDLLEVLGYTDHSEEHSLKTGELAGNILTTLGHDERTVELSKIAGYMHDIGCMVARSNHPQTGAMIAFNILTRLNMDYREIALIAGAIGNHDESIGVPISAVAAALIIADKSDMRPSRVRPKDIATFDIHDRVNYAVIGCDVSISTLPPEILLNVTIDTEISTIIDFFECFMSRMFLCKQAAEFLDARFRLRINGLDIT